MQIRVHLLLLSVSALKPFGWMFEISHSKPMYRDYWEKCGRSLATQNKNNKGLRAKYSNYGKCGQQSLGNAVDWRYCGSRRRDAQKSLVPKSQNSFREGGCLTKLLVCTCCYDLGLKEKQDSSFFFSLCLILIRHGH